MRKQLFRKEVFESRGRSLIGDVLIKQETSLTKQTLIIFSIAILLCFFLSFTTYAKRERVSGFLVPDKGLIKVTAGRKGTIIENHVVEGDIVKAGDILFTLSMNQNSVDGKALAEEVLAELGVAQLELESQIYNQNALLAQELDRLNAKKVSNKREKQNLQEQIAVNSERVSLIGSTVQRLKKLFNEGAISEQVLEEKHAEMLLAQESLTSLERQKLRVEIETDEILSLVNKLPIENNILVAGLNRQLADLRQKKIQAKGNATFTIKAPVAGTITAILVSTGQHSLTDALLLTILPQNANLQAHLFVPARAIGFIKPKQQVNLRYSAFPYQRYGVHEGKINEISKAILKPDELSVPIKLTEPVYRLKVSLKDKTIKIGTEKITLQSGLILEADIILENRRLIDWLFVPFSSSDN